MFVGFLAVFFVAYTVGVVLQAIWLAILPKI